MRRVLISGSRNTKDSATIRDAFNTLTETYGKDVTIIHGGQKTWNHSSRSYHGVDHLADELATEFGFQTEVFPAEWKKHEGCRCADLDGVCYFAGPRRNQKMLDDGKPDEAHAFHEDPGLGRGTRDCVARVRKAGIPCTVHSTPVGELRK